MDEEDVERRIFDLVKTYLEGESVSGLDHTLRVQRWCELIGKVEEADLHVLRVAALLHDVGVPSVGRKRHFEESALMAEKQLEDMSFPKEKIDQIVHVIRAHSRFGGPKPGTKEAKILFDADVLDSIGAVGIVRAIGRGLVEKTFSGDVDEAPQLLKKVIADSEGKFHTEEAKKIGAGYLRFMERFLERLKGELSRSSLL